MGSFHSHLTSMQPPYILLSSLSLLSSYLSSSPPDSAVLGILELIFWNLSRKWVTWQKKFKCAWFSYLLLHSKPPQTLVAENNSNFIIRHNSVSELELSRVIISAGLIRGISCCCSQIVEGLKHPRWIHSDFSLEGDAEAGCWASQASLFPCVISGSLSLHVISAQNASISITGLLTCLPGLQNA